MLDNTVVHVISHKFAKYSIEFPSNRSNNPLSLPGYPSAIPLVPVSVSASAVAVGVDQSGVQNPQQQQQMLSQQPQQSPMAALMSVADALPPGSPRSSTSSGGPSPPGPPQGVPPPVRSASRGSQHSPNSSGRGRR